MLASCGRRSRTINFILLFSVLQFIIAPGIPLREDLGTSASTLESTKMLMKPNVKDGTQGDPKPQVKVLNKAYIPVPLKAAASDKIANQGKTVSSNGDFLAKQPGSAASSKESLAKSEARLRSATRPIPKGLLSNNIKEVKSPEVEPKDERDRVIVTQDAENIQSHTEPLIPISLAQQDLINDYVKNWDRAKMTSAEFHERFASLVNRVSPYDKRYRTTYKIKFDPAFLDSAHPRPKFTPVDIPAAANAHHNTPGHSGLPTYAYVGSTPHTLQGNYLSQTYYPHVTQGNYLPQGLSPYYQLPVPNYLSQTHYPHVTLEDYLSQTYYPHVTQGNYLSQTYYPHVTQEDYLSQGRSPYYQPPVPNYLLQGLPSHVPQENHLSQTQHPYYQPSVSNYLSQTQYPHVTQENYPSQGLPRHYQPLLPGKGEARFADTRKKMGQPFGATSDNLSNFHEPAKSIHMPDPKVNPSVSAQKSSEFDKRARKFLLENNKQLISQSELEELLYGASENQKAGRQT
ncbi:hypothetical protein CROQUDRAFT_713544 [Cronartium quercuum f. sp. fusiforme G11]|uniref:Uncharacterized protein n=1 Tax=Cronartium quercuum f. sp. fusiforme G11 TaxID=708437 RepID=A0A9P6NTU2_9BASI|nr:hypothetical protein CROQUDRAFT_713544 [Cronartium quercuum f. sp. fusiforme G11]